MQESWVLEVRREWEVRTPYSNLFLAGSAGARVIVKVIGCEGMVISRPHQGLHDCQGVTMNAFSASPRLISWRFPGGALT
jgi:hypothetical protein